MTADGATVATLIVTFGRADETLRAVDSLAQQATTGDHHIVIWENGTSASLGGHDLDTTWRDRDAVVHYAGGRGNLGYAAGVDTAYEVACRRVERDPDVVVCVNPDVVCAPGALAVLITELDVGGWSALAPLTRFADGSVRPNAYPRFRPWLCWVRFLELRLNRRFGSRPDPGTAVEPADVVDGAFLVVRGEAWRAVGGLDAGYAISTDDYDFCTRVLARGGRVGICPSAEVLHIGGTSRASRPTLSRLSRVHSVVRFVDRFHSRWLPFSRMSIATANLLRHPSAAGVELAWWALRVPPTLPSEPSDIDDRFASVAIDRCGRAGRRLATKLRAEAA